MSDTSVDIIPGQFLASFQSQMVLYWPIRADSKCKWYLISLHLPASKFNQIMPQPTTWL